MELILADVEQAIQAAAPGLHCPEGIDGARLLRALCLQESDGGRFNMPRYEPAYGPPAGRYYAKSPRLRDLYARYGKMACSSVGPWQEMFINAADLGFDDAPWLLFEPDLAAREIVKFLNRRVFPQATSLRDIADAYNSGNCRDGNVPGEYITSLIAHYDEVPA